MKFDISVKDITEEELPLVIERLKNLKGDFEEKKEVKRKSSKKSEEAETGFVMPPVVQAPQQYAPPELPVMPQEPVVQAPVHSTPPAAPVEVNMGNLLHRIQTAFSTGRMTAPDMIGLIQSVNSAFGATINNITEITDNAPMVKFVSQLLEQKGI